jgi:hypothetical protein
MRYQLKMDKTHFLKNKLRSIKCIGTLIYVQSFKSHTLFSVRLPFPYGLVRMCLSGRFPILTIKSQTLNLCLFDRASTHINGVGAVISPAVKI